MTFSNPVDCCSVSRLSVYEMLHDSQMNMLNLIHT